MAADAATVRQLGNFPDALIDSQIDLHLKSGERRVRRWVGDTFYDTWKDGAGAEGEALKTAVAAMAIYYGVDAWNTVVSHSEADGAAGIMQAGRYGDDSFQHLTAAAIEKKKNHYFQMAEEAVAGYTLDSFGGGSPGPARSFAHDDDGEAIDDTYPD
jgi:hypothetical protein